MFKKICSLLLSLLLIFTLFPQNIFAQDLTPSSVIQWIESNQEFFPVAENYDSLTTLAPNAIPINIIARQDGTGVDVKVGNVGVDGLDSVTVTVTATGYTTPKSKTAYVPPVVGKTFSFNFPFIKCNTTYKVTVHIVDGSGTRTKSGKATLNFSEDTLKSANWLKGTFSTRAASLEYHFSKHKNEVNATNLVTYLNLATNYRTEVVNDIKQGNKTKYKITVGSGSIPSHKYKNQNDGRFIILSDSGYGIFSFGI